MKQDDLHDVDKVLNLARDVPPPTDADKARVRAALAAKLGGAGLLAAGAKHAAATGAKSWLGLTAGKWLGLAAVSVGVGVGVASLPRGGDTTQTAAANVPRSATAHEAHGGAALPEPLAPSRRDAPAHTETSPRTEGEVGPAASPPRVAFAPRKPARGASTEDVPPPVVVAPPAPEPPSLHEQLAVLRGVHAHLSARAYDDALALLAAREASFAGTPLAEEARALDVIARCGARSPSAVERARAFVTDYPTSVHRTRIETACGRQPP